MIQEKAMNIWIPVVIAMLASVVSGIIGALRTIAGREEIKP
jgi:hypothetical protein